jgi:hypothetical protein
MLDVRRRDGVAVIGPASPAVFDQRIPVPVGRDAAAHRRGSAEPERSPYAVPVRDSMAANICGAPVSVVETRPAEPVRDSLACG